MSRPPLNNRFLTGFVSGLILPLLVFLGVYIFTGDGMSLKAFTERIISRNTLTLMMSLCVFPNGIIFLVFNYFDKLKSAKGVLGITIIWALAVFAIKFL
ncbi:MAG: hypothetical protein KFF49_01595 [Bacteroidales bacterium]|nr:hypothetical protein [Bacteroidales bacterium]